jgi:two-component system NtrC family sensor kinase
MSIKWLLHKIQVGLRTEVILNIGILVVASLLLIGFTILKVSENEILEQKIAGGEIILSSLRRSITDIQGEKWYQDPNLSRILITFTQLSEVEEIWIVDRNMRSLISRGIGVGYEDGLRDAIAQGKKKVKVERRGTLWWSFYKRLVLSSPLMKGGEIIGGLQVSFSLSDVTDRLVVFRKLVLILILVDSLVLVAFGSFLLARVVVNPLKRLVDVVHKIRGGELDQRAQVEYENEIGQLAKAFNQMVESLAEKHRDLETTIKKLKETQEELVLSEKLASVGRLAAGVAHEIGNPLASVLGHTEILSKKLKDNGVLLDLVQRTRRETERINRIIKDLLLFSRPPTSQIENVDMNRVIQDSLDLVIIQKKFRNIALDLSLDKNLSPVRGNRDQLHQVLINILINAADAMPKGGCLSIKTEEMKEWVTISIKDTGEGIPAEDLDKIFDPFYTTKSPEKGTGLGLSISLMIIEDLGGKMKVESEKGRGAEFTIFLKK